MRWLSRLLGGAMVGLAGGILAQKFGHNTFILVTIPQISIHLQQMGKIGPFGKSKKVFWHIQNGQKGF
jgi:hypothetical protein